MPILSQFCDTMKSATIRDLRYDFARLEAWLEGGEEILITRHSKPVAKLMPPNRGSKKKKRPALPDYEARLRRIWGNRVFTQAEVDEARALETGEP